MDHGIRAHQEDLAHNFDVFADVRNGQADTYIGLSIRVSQADYAPDGADLTAEVTQMARRLAANDLTRIREATEAERTAGKTAKVVDVLVAIDGEEVELTFDQFERKYGR